MKLVRYFVIYYRTYGHLQFNVNHSTATSTVGTAQTGVVSGVDMSAFNEQRDDVAGLVESCCDVKLCFTTSVQPASTRLTSLTATTTSDAGSRRRRFHDLRHFPVTLSCHSPACQSSLSTQQYVRRTYMPIIKPPHATARAA